MAIKLKLDEVLVRQGMTLSELSNLVGISLPNLSRMKTGHIRAVRFSTLDAVCEALDCQPGDILERVPDCSEKQA